MHKPANRQPHGVEFLETGCCHIRPRDILCRQRRGPTKAQRTGPCNLGHEEAAALRGLARNLRIRFNGLTTTKFARYFAQSGDTRRY
jgi:hypothetical protein